MYKVYVKTDNVGRIIAVNSNAFLSSFDGWIEIDSGTGDKYHHAQGNYLPLPIMDEHGVYRYKLVDGCVVERTQDEMDADKTAEDILPTTLESRVESLEQSTKTIKATNAELAETIDMILRGATSDDENEMA